MILLSHQNPELNVILHLHGDQANQPQSGQEDTGKTFDQKNEHGLDYEGIGGRIQDNNTRKGEFGWWGNKGCPEGYESKEGDIPGWGQIKGQIGGNLQYCADRCDETEECCSFEHSSLWNWCNLNRDCEPTQGKFMEYVFCTKKKVDDEAFIIKQGQLFDGYQIPFLGKQ